MDRVKPALVSVAAGTLWFPVIISGCMGVYVVGASRQGLGWFSFEHNPYLLLQLGAGASCLVAGFRPAKPVVALAGASWAAYAATITRQRLHFREWRYIAWAHLPLLLLGAAYAAL